MQCQAGRRGKLRFPVSFSEMLDPLKEQCAQHLAPIPCGRAAGTKLLKQIAGQGVLVPSRSQVIEHPVGECRRIRSNHRNSRFQYRSFPVLHALPCVESPMDRAFYCANPSGRLPSCGFALQSAKRITRKKGSRTRMAGALRSEMAANGEGRVMTGFSPNCASQVSCGGMRATSIGFMCAMIDEPTGMPASWFAGWP